MIPLWEEISAKYDINNELILEQNYRKQLQTSKIFERVQKRNNSISGHSKKM